MMNKRNLNQANQAKGKGGVMDGWKTIGTNHVNYEFMSTNKSFECKSTFSINIINR
jgi:hypothetical protein